ncbi:MAG: hypothetical protein GYA24_12500 [Candidatus Lokiarchaeota archaeon]|nr:hypothetical protein [Candidatus Lokiarchaeota archaeon]
MAFRKFIVANLYIITIAWFIGGFGWMFALVFLPSSFDLVLPAFFVTVAGNLWLWAANHFSNSDGKQKVKGEKRNHKGMEIETRHDLPPSHVTATH